MPEYAAHFRLLDDGGEIVTATRRQAHELTRAYSARQVAAGRSVWATPRIVPWSAWTTRLWRDVSRESGRAAVLLDAFACSRAWERIVEASASGRALLDPRAAGRAAAQTWTRAHEWGIDPAAIEPVTAEQAAFHEWAAAWLSLSAERGWIDPARLAGEVAAAATMLARIGALAPGGVGFHGFESATAARSRVSEALNRAGIPTRDLALDVRPRSTSICAAEGPDAELEAIAAWIVARLRANPAARLAVIVPDLATRWPELRRVMDDRLQPSQLVPGATGTRPYASSTGPRLRDYALVDVALGLLGLARDRIDLVRAGRLLRSPYPRGADREASRRAMLDAHLRRAGDVRPTVERVRLTAADDRHGCTAFATLIATVRRETEGPTQRSSAHWATAFERALVAGGWHDARPLTSDEYQVAAKFHESLATLGSLERVLGPLTLGEALDELAGIAADTPFQPESDDAPVLFLDTLSAPGLSLDGLWIAGLTADRLPAASRPDPFLPLTLQIGARMPHASAEIELEYARRTMETWLRSASEVVLSWPHRDADGERLPSPLLPAMLPAFAMEAPRPSRATGVRATAALESWTDVPLPALPEAAPLRGGVEVLAAQSACPFRAGLQFRLGVKPLEQPVFGLDARTRGTLAHEALAAFWRDVRTQQRLRELGAAGTAERIRAAIDVACESLSADVRRSRVLGVERRWLERAMLALTAKELERAPFEVIACEAQRTLTIARRRLDVRIDRIDRLQDGASVLIDYKTGQGPLAPARWTGDRPDQPQLPAYAAHVEAPPVALAFGRLALVAVGFAGLSAREGLLPDVKTTAKARHDALRGRPWDSLIDEWQRVTTALAAAHARGVADVDPTDEACRHCAHAAVCRIDGAVTEEPESDDADE